MPAFTPAVGHTVPTDLNSRQREAVMYLNGPCLVLAGAGSGKTRVITQKMAYLLRECGYQGRDIVALTFTNKAAREMSERVKGLVDNRLAKGLTVSTFHSLGLRFLREEARHAGLKPNFSILDAHDVLGIIQEMLATTDKVRLRAVAQIISLWKNALLDADQADRLAASPSEAEAARIYRSYSATLEAYQAVDFDDLIRLPALLLEHNTEVRERWQHRVKYLLVDEYQDTNACQYRLVRWLTGDRSLFTAVGDDDQAIYAWRGATSDNLPKLTSDYPALKLIKLEQNYRSAQRILTAANHVISKNPNLFNKKLWSDLGVGEPIQVTAMDDDRTEAESVAFAISAARVERQAHWRDFAVLYRSNQQARIVEQALRDLRIPYTISGGQSFFEKPEIRDILAYLRLIANDDDDPAFIRAATTPRRGIGQATLKALGQHASQTHMSLFAALYEVTEEHIPARQLQSLRVFGEFIQRIQRRAGRSQPQAHAYAGAGPERDLFADMDAGGGGSGAGAGPNVGVADAVANAAGLPRGNETADVLLDDLLAAIDYERHLYDTLDDRAAQGRWQNVLELVGWLKRKAAEDGLNLIELTQHVALVTMLQRGDDDEPDAVKLSTLHASKGLEYPHVYLIGVEEGLLPHSGRDDEDADPETAAELLAQRIQEERRLMYVGITRAQRTLHLSWCRKRRRARDDVVREVSRFIGEMELEQPKIKEDPDMRGLSPSQRLGMLKSLLDRSERQI
jgi:ATP-dependent DNA helicase Rep